MRIKDQFERSLMIEQVFLFGTAPGIPRRPFDALLCCQRHKRRDRSRSFRI